VPKIKTVLSLIGCVPSQRWGIVKPKPSWSCIHQCGACCRLAPEERQEALDVLSEEQRKLYLEMVGPDGWCRHYDSGGRRCRIYSTRPDFCDVRHLSKLFGVSVDQADAFAISCCKQQIRSIYGGRSKELRRFKRSMNQLEQGNA